MSITGKQIAMARILLDLSQEDLAKKIGIARKTINRIENSQSPGSTGTIEKIKNFLEAQGIIFTEQEGIKKSNNIVRILTSLDGYQAFRNEVYQTMRENGGIVLVNNVDEKKFTNVISAQAELEYLNNMKTIKNMDFKILCQEDDYNFIAQDYAEYRWTPKDQFATVPFYLFKDKLAIILFDEKPVTINIIQSSELAKAFKIQFMQMWKQAIIPPNKKAAQR